MQIYHQSIKHIKIAFISLNKVSLVLDGKKATSRITRNVAHSIHHPSLEKYLREIEEWSDSMWNEIAWPSFKISFNKIPSAKQPTITKNALQFMVHKEQTPPRESTAEAMLFL
jgi:hypothetical protein